MEALDEAALEAAFLDALSRNHAIGTVLDRLQPLALPGACLAGGCLFQTVWNAAHDLPPGHGIDDYDVFYFDDRDLTAEGEAVVSQRLHPLATDLGIAIDVRNQARVHLWYESEYGTASPPFHSCEEGIDHFLAPCCAFGLRREASRSVVYAPFGYSDLFSLTVRPNPRRIALNGEALREAFRRKTGKWQRLWPRLQVVPWP